MIIFSKALLLRFFFVFGIFLATDVDLIYSSQTASTLPTMICHIELTHLEEGSPSVF